MSAHHPIGVFDSGIGGLSVLQSLRQALPNERFVYLADTAHAPYGEKSDHAVRERSHAITHYLLEQYPVKALVVACNTATAAAIDELRASHPQLPLVGVEPALKPAALLTRTGHVGVMATRGTVSSDRFARLLALVKDQARFEVCACNGLALAIEQTTWPALHLQAVADVSRLLKNCIRSLGVFGTGPGQIDTLVLGCTHYVFAAQALQQLVGQGVQLVSTGDAVARQTRRLLELAGLLQPPQAAVPIESRIELLTTGQLAGLQSAAGRWLGLTADCCDTAAIL
jgi:glutamate racemase